MSTRKIVVFAVFLLMLASTNVMAQSADTQFVTDVYHTTALTCDSGWTLTSSSLTAGTCEINREPATIQTCVKKARISEANTFLSNGVLKKTTACVSPYQSASSTNFYGRAGDQCAIDVSLCKLQTTKRADNKFYDENGNVITSLITDIQVLINDPSNTYGYHYPSCQNNCCPTGYTQLDAVFLGGHAYTDPFYLCAKYASIDSSALQPKCQLSYVGISGDCMMRPNPYTNVTPIGCKNGDLLQVYTTTAGCPNDGILKLTSPAGACSINAQMSMAGRQTEVSPNPPYNTGAQMDWTLSGVPASCSGQTIYMTNAYILNASNNDILFSLPLTSRNQIKFVSDFVPPSLDIQVSNPTVYQNRHGSIFFTASSSSYNDIANITIYVTATDIDQDPCLAENYDFPCTRYSLFPLPEDEDIEYYAVAYDFTGNRAETAHKHLVINTGNNLTTEVKDIAGDNDVPYYVPSDNLNPIISVRGKVSGNSGYATDIRCRWGLTDAGYKEMRSNPRTSFSCQTQFGSTIASCPISNSGQFCSPMDAGRENCTVYIACTDSKEIYNQTALTNLGVSWIHGADTDAPLILSVRPANDEIVATSTIMLNATTDEKAMCRFWNQSASYSQMPATNTMNDVTGTKFHQAILSRLLVGQNTYYISCKDIAGNEMTEAVSTSFVRTTAALAKRVILSASTTTARPDQAVQITATVRDSEGNYAPTPITIAFSATGDVDIDSSCTISGQNCTISLNAHSALSTTITASAQGADNGTISVTFKGTGQCNDGVCDLSSENPAVCSSDCKQNYALTTSVTQITDPSYGVKFSSILSPNFPEGAQYFICDVNSSFVQCLSSPLCKNTGVIPDYSCSLSCSNKNGQFYAMISNAPRGIKIAGKIASYSCPGITGVNDFENWVDQFTIIVNSIIPGDLSIVRNALADPNLPAETRQLYQQREANLIDAKSLVEPHLVYLHSVQQNPTQAAIDEANTKSQQVYDRYVAMLNPTYQSVKLAVSALNFTTPVQNGSMISIITDVSNSGTENRFALVSCRFTDPNGNTVINKSACMSVPAGQDNVFISQLLANRAGKWNITCGVNASFMPDCQPNVEHAKTSSMLVDVKANIVQESRCGNGVCESTENANNCGIDCSTENIFLCLGRCEKTSDTGVNFLANVRSFNFINFFICNRGASPESCISSYQANTPNCGFGKPCLCGSTASSQCSINCIDNIGEYYMLVQAPTLETRASNANYSFSCPIVNLDELINNRTKFSNDLLTYQAQKTNIASSISRDLTNSTKVRLQPCYDAYSTIIENVTAHIGYLDGVISSPSLKNVTKAFTESRKVDTYIENTLNSYCAQSGLLRIDSIDIPGNMTLGVPGDIVLHITSVGEISYYGYAICDVKAPNTSTVIKMSSLPVGCYQFNAGTSGTIPVNFTPELPGEWHLDSCSVYASFSPTCGSTLHDTITGGVIDVNMQPDPSPPATSILCNNAECGSTYTTSVSVNLSCTDIGSGCKQIFYCTDKENRCIASTKYNGQFTVSAGGVTFIRYFSTDYFGNIEQTKSRSVEISTARCGDNICEPTEVNSCPSDCSYYFNSVSYDQTERGVRLKASTNQILPGSRMVACNSTSTVGECKNAYVAGNCGFEKKCLCGWMPFENGCELRCGDGTNEFYAINYQPIGNQSIVVSSRQTFTCPVLNKNTLLNYLKEFEDFYTLAVGELQSSANMTGTENYRSMYEEIRLIALDQKTYLQNVLLDLTVTNSQEAIQRSQQKESEISSLLSAIGNYQRSISITGVAVDDSVRIGKDVKIKIENSGNFWRYGTVDCRFRKPDGNFVDTSSTCVELPPKTTIYASSNLNLNVLGNWLFKSCNLKIALSKSCMPSLQYGSYATERAFTVREANKLSLNASISYQTVTFGNKAPVSVYIRNDEDMSRYAISKCTIRKPDGTSTSVQSNCVNMSANTRIMLTPYVIANVPGDWSVETCTAEEGNSSSCSVTAIQDSQSYIGDFSVIIDKTLSITSSGLAADQVKMGDAPNINVAVKNSAGNKTSAFVNCTLTDSSGNTRIAVASSQQIASGATVSFRPILRTDVAGRWSVGSCSVYRMLNFTNFEQSSEINKEFIVAAAPECSTSSQCLGTVTSCECISGACNPCGFGYSCEQGRCRLQQSNECLGTASSCYSDGSSCVACSGGSICSNGSCVTPGNQPTPTVPLFLIIIVALAVLTPIIIFVFYKIMMR